MNLKQIAQQAMNYLDSAGVAADYEIKSGKLIIITDDYEKYFFHSITYWRGTKHISVYEAVMMWLKEEYPTKSPN